MELAWLANLEGVSFDRKKHSTLAELVLNVKSLMGRYAS